MSSKIEKACATHQYNITAVMRKIRFVSYNNKLFPYLHITFDCLFIPTKWKYIVTGGVPLKRIKRSQLIRIIFFIQTRFLSFCSAQEEWLGFVEKEKSNSKSSSLLSWGFWRTEKSCLENDVINISRARDKERNWSYDLLYTGRML